MPVMEDPLDLDRVEHLLLVRVRTYFEADQS